MSTENFQLHGISLLLKHSAIGHLLQCTVAELESQLKAPVQINENVCNSFTASMYVYINCLLCSDAEISCIELCWCNSKHRWIESWWAVFSLKGKSPSCPIEVNTLLTYSNGQSPVLSDQIYKTMATHVSVLYKIVAFFRQEFKYINSVCVYGTSAWQWYMYVHVVRVQILHLAC